jgi:hypothetical protein
MGMPRFNSPMTAQASLRVGPGPARVLVRWVVGPMAIAGRAVCPAILLLPYMMVLHVTGGRKIRLAALLVTVCILTLCGGALARHVFHRSRTLGQVDLDDLAFVIGCVFWSLAAVLFLNYSP